MYVCVCVCMYERTYVRMYVCMCMYVYVCMYVCMYVCTYLPTSTSPHLPISTHVFAELCLISLTGNIASLAESKYCRTFRRSTAALVCFVFWRTMIM